MHEQTPFTAALAMMIRMQHVEWARGRGAGLGKGLWIDDSGGMKRLCNSVSSLAPRSVVRCSFCNEFRNFVLRVDG